MFFYSKATIKRISWLLFIAISFLALDNFHFVDRLFSLGSEARENFGLEEHLKRAIFILWYALAILSLWAAAELKPVQSIPALFIIWPFTIIDLTLHKIYGFPAQIMNIAVLNGALGNTFDALIEYQQEIISALSRTSILFVPLFIRAAQKKPNIAPIVPCSFFLLLAISFGSVLTVRGEYSLGSFPKGFSYSFSSLSIALNDFYVNNYIKKEIKIPSPLNQQPRSKVVLIIDESISYEYFQRLYPGKSSYVVDYGLTRSAANCSAASNFALRKAGWERGSHGILDIEQIQSVFEIAKKTGYHTVFFDNQNVLLEPIVKNFFDQFELRYVDSIYQGSGPTYERDASTIEKLIKELERDRVFVVVNKVGAHFPYESTIPPEIRMHDRTQDYLNSIQINSVNYLIEIQNKIDSETVVFYTSDHGQYLQGKTTHCNLGDNVNKNEYLVPFLLISKDSDLIDKARLNLKKYHGSLSHIEISESIRNAMGFSLSEYDSIFKNPTHLNKNFCGLYGPPKTFFGTKPRCFLIE